MLIDDIKKANIEAMKAHDQEARTSLSMVIARYQEQLTNGSGNKVTDADVRQDRPEAPKGARRRKRQLRQSGPAEQAAAIERAKETDPEAVSLPKMFSEEEIRKIYASLPTRRCRGHEILQSSHYDGQVDMSLVSKIARGL
jgi:uncharacterized protein YqeY